MSKLSICLCDEDCPIHGNIDPDVGMAVAQSEYYRVDEQKEAMCEENAEIRSELKQTQKKLDAAVEALKFYKSEWYESGPSELLLQDEGKRARQVIQEGL